MRLLIFFLVMVSISFAEPSWILNPQDSEGKVSAVGMAEGFFPSHVQERVALVRARTKLREKLEQDKGYNPNKPAASVKSEENLGLKIHDKYTDAEGNLYLFVSLP